MAWEPDENVKVLDSDQDELMLKSWRRLPSSPIKR